MERQKERCCGWKKGKLVEREREKEKEKQIDIKGDGGKEIQRE